MFYVYCPQIHIYTWTNYYNYYEKDLFNFFLLTYIVYTSYQLDIT